jgi:hypothetical protein
MGLLARKDAVSKSNTQNIDAQERELAIVIEKWANHQITAKEIEISYETQGNNYVYFPNAILR